MKIQRNLIDSVVLLTSRTYALARAISELPQLALVICFIVSIGIGNKTSFIAAIVAFLLLISFFKIVGGVSYFIWVRLLFIGMVGMSLGYGRLFIDNKVESAQKEYWQDYVGEDNAFEGVIVEEPKLRHEDTTVVFQVNPEVNGSTDRETVKVIANIPRFPKVSLGDKCEVRGKLKVPETFTDFDYVNYLRNRRVYYLLQVSNLACVPAKWSDSPRVGLYSVKQKVVSVIERNLHEPSASLMVGILLGDDRVFDDTFEKSLRVTGTTHIIAASGYNISLISISIERMLGSLIKPFGRAVITMILIWSFALMSGLSPSILRAVIMASLILLANISGRLRSVHLILPYTVFIFLLYDPRVFYSIGFQLSVLSTGSLIYLMPIAEYFIRCLNRKTVEGVLIRVINEFFLPTLCCTVGTAPLIVTIFKEISLIGLISNLLVLPIVEFIMIMGLLGLCFVQISSFLSGLFFDGSSVLLQYFKDVILRLGEWNWAVASVQADNLWITLFLPYLLIFLIIILFYPTQEDNIYFRNY